LKSVQKYEAQNINRSKKYPDGIPSVVTNGTSITAQIKKLTQEHKLAIETLAGHNLLNIYKKKVSALQHEPEEETSNVQEIYQPASK
jgi:hypothetical protein